MSYQFHILLEWGTVEQIWVSYVPALNYLSTYGETRGDHAELLHLEVAVS
jgi:predicted RNase H-like HicB family nuclease